MKAIGVIPARYQSSRFPGKPLVKIGGISMIQRVFEKALESNLLSTVIVATDDERIQEEVLSFGGLVQMTKSSHISGTDRVAEVAEFWEDGDVYINIQGDEPFIDPTQIDSLIETFRQPQVDIATLATPIHELGSLLDSNTVKVVTGLQGRALYFSRSPIPFIREKPQEEWLNAQKHFQHIGVYAYRREVLLSLPRLPKGNYERLESLEQLRWLEAGYKIYVVKTASTTFGIDTPEDLKKAQNWLDQHN